MPLCIIAEDKVWNIILISVHIISNWCQIYIFLMDKQKRCFQGSNPGHLRDKLKLLSYTLVGAST